jgi:hypothetical protein
VRFAVLLPFALVAGACSDGGGGGTTSDSGTEPDAKSGHDSGSHSDAKAPHDTGSPKDAKAARDGGLTTDGSSSNGDAQTDVGTSLDTGAGGDTGADAGMYSAVAPVPPTVVSTDPPTAATGVSVVQAIHVLFSEAIAPLTLTMTSFTLVQGGTTILGAVSYFNDTATFTPSAALAVGMMYTATITTAVTDVAGQPLATTYSWTFTTAAATALGPPPVYLGSAGNYVALAKTAITNVPTSAITGNLGLSPAAASYITGFALTRAGTEWTSSQVNGGVFAANNDPPTPANLTTAVGAMQAAYTDAAGRPTPNFLNLGGGAIGGLTLVPGLYKWTTDVTLPSDVTISGGANDEWIFQITGKLTTSSAKNMILAGGAQAKNIVWQVAGAVDIGTTSQVEGVILCQTAITLETGASIEGRLLAQTAVNLAGNAVTAPAP